MIERFYTDSCVDEGLIDQIEIDAQHKKYQLYLASDMNIADGWDESGEEIYSFYISREVFDIILSGLQDKNFVCIKTI